MLSRTSCISCPRMARQQRSAIVLRAADQVTSTASVPKSTNTASYFVIKNVFKVKEDSYEAFEDIWKTRESHLKEMPGFIRFAMLKCINIPGKYVSETHWQTRDDFEVWTKSSQFKASHGGGKGDQNGQAQGGRPKTMGMMEGPPSPELYETVTTTSME